MDQEFRTARARVLEGVEPPPRRPRSKATAGNRRAPSPSQVLERAPGSAARDATSRRTSCTLPDRSAPWGRILLPPSWAPTSMARRSRGRRPPSARFGFRSQSVRPLPVPPAPPPPGRSAHRPLAQAVDSEWGKGRSLLHLSGKGRPGATIKYASDPVSIPRLQHMLQDLVREPSLMASLPASGRGARLSASRALRARKLFQPPWGRT